MSVENAILDGIVTMVQGLTLGPTVVKRKAPKREFSVDTGTIITVAPGPDKPIVTPLAFRGPIKVSYKAEIAILAPNEDDYLSNFTTYGDWREKIRDLFRPPFASPVIPGVAEVFDLNPEPGEFFDPEAIEDLQDYFTIRVEAVTAE